MEDRKRRRSVVLDSVDEKLELLANWNIFFIGGVIDENTLGGLFANMFTRLSPENKKPIWVILNSPGGDLHQGLAVYDLLRAITLQGWEVNIISIGQVASMAVCILQAGTKRYALPNAQFTVHQASISSGQGMEANEFREASKELDRVNEIVLRIIAQRSGASLEELKRISNKTDYSVNADDAKVFGPHGLIDEVIDTFPFQINGS